MSRLTISDMMVENYNQQNSVGTETPTQANNSYEFVDEVIDSLKTPEKKVIILNITINSKQRKDFLKQISKNYERVCLFLANDEISSQNDDNVKSFHFNSVINEGIVSVSNDEVFSSNDINIVLRLQPKRGIRKTGWDNSLTIREEEILNFLSQGLLYKEIAKNLNISLQTVKSHLKHIYAKLQVCNRTEAILKYFQAV